MVVFFFNGPTTYKRVETITKEIGGTIPQRVMSPIGIIRYLTHKDNPEKAQYDERDIKTINGLDLREINGLTTTQIEDIKWQLIDFIQTNKIDEYAELIDELKKIDYREGLEIASNKTIFFATYLKSRHFMIDK